MHIFTKYGTFKWTYDRRRGLNRDFKIQRRDGDKNVA